MVSSVAGSTIGGKVTDAPQRFVGGLRHNAADRTGCSLHGLRSTGRRGHASRHPDAPASRVGSRSLVDPHPTPEAEESVLSAGQYDAAQTRPRAARMPRRERRAQLLESALEVFVAQGYHAAAMDDIAERAGVSKPVLYQHFPGKLDLYLALLDSSCDQIIDNCRVALQSTHDNKMRVAATMDAFFEYVAGDNGAFRLVFESDLTNEPAVREHVERVTSECAEMIAEVIHDDTGLPDEASRLLAV